MSQYSREGFKIETNKNSLDKEMIFNYLHNEAYWSKGIPRHLVNKSIENSIAFGVFEEEVPSKQLIRQVGFGRIITDLSTFAYLADVFILPEFRGFGLGKWLVHTMVNYPEIQQVRRILLATKDAHGLYKQYNFNFIENQHLFMEITQKDIYKKMSNK
ncbi:GNAT family N-acetyltransferase [Niallia sp. 01092]|uniref:GNAT family N-acetyltransferase n=1 Tax=unclassified Niallia TaxID=2837522 RepID=UPI003FD075EA